LDDRLEHVRAVMEEQAALRATLDRFARFEAHCDEAAFHEISLTEAEAPAHRARVRREARAALRELGLPPGGGPDEVAAALESQRDRLAAVGRLERTAGLCLR